MSQGAPQDHTGEAARNSAALLRPVFSKGRGSRPVAANDNRPDWRSVFTQRVMRPLRRILAFCVSLVRALWIAKR
jgi:hypothetical protein